MFLRPHHLQHYDLYVESREVGYLHALESYGWGLTRLEIQVDALDNFLLSVKALRAVLHDGTLVEVPGNARLPSRQIDRKIVEVGRTLDVSVGIHNVDERRSQAAAETDTPGLTRFAPVTEEIYDLETGRDPIPVERLEYDLRVFLGDEPTHGYETIPITRLAMTGDPARPLGFAPGFAPPCLAISASEVLHGAARGVLERLGTVLRKQGSRRGGEKASELVLYQALAGCFPVLKDMVSDGMVHPRRVYQEMARLAGTLYFRDTTGKSFDEIPAYDHGDPGPVFETLRRLIEPLSEFVFEEKYLKVQLERKEDLFRTDLPGAAKKEMARVFLQVLAQESTPRVKTLLMGARVSTHTRIEQLTMRALPGVPNEILAGQPSEMEPGQPGTFFRLKVETGTEWTNQVVPAGDVAVHLMNAPQDIKVYLVVILAAS